MPIVMAPALNACCARAPDRLLPALGGADLLRAHVGVAAGDLAGTQSPLLGAVPPAAIRGFHVGGAG